MKYLCDIFQNEIGIPFPDIPANLHKLIPLSKPPEKCLLFGSESAANTSYLLGNPDDFIETAPQGYFLVGFWGHGVNSYAFYYVNVDRQRKVYFRLPYGGVYSDPETDAERIREFLTAFFKFSNEVIKEGDKLIAVESMGSGLYKIECTEGKTFEKRESFIENPRFEEIFNMEKS